MRTPARLGQLFGIAAVSLMVACSGTESKPGGQTNGGGGSSGAAGSVGMGGAGAGGATTGAGSGGAGSGGGGSGGSGSGGSVATATDASSDAPPDASATAGDAATTEAGGDVRAPAMASDGCGKTAPQALTTFMRHNVSQKTNNQQRVYDLYLPANYDAMRAYPIIFLDHGCDGSIPFMENPSMTTVTKGNAIIVALRAYSSQQTGQLYGGGCFDTGPGSTSLTEVPYFDQVLQDVGDMACVDKARVFMAGFSSGSWLTNLLGCVRAGVIRAQGNSTGGLPSVPKVCAGPIASMMVHDMQDPQNSYAGGEIARDRILAIDGCSMTMTVPYDYDGDPATPSTCMLYQGCMSGYPVVWCPTMNKGHVDQVPITTTGLWRFWSQF
jgi:polyhydroxybutyrate depolymerase